MRENQEKGKIIAVFRSYELQFVVTPEIEVCNGSDGEVCTIGRPNYAHIPLQNLPKNSQSNQTHCKIDFIHRVIADLDDPLHLTTSL